MKKIKFLLLAVAAGFYSCDNAIDITQPGELTPERAYETVEDLQLGLNGVYGGIPGENQVYFTSLFTDEVALGRANGGQGTDGELGFVLNNNSGDAASIWVSNYGVINAANRLLLGAENIEPAAEDMATYNNILAQTRAIRALAYLQLETYFAPDMKDDSGLGVILLDYVPELYDQLPRSTNGEIYDFMLADLEFAEANIIDVPVTTRTYIGKNTINAIRARLAAYRGQYALAKTYVDALDVLYNLTPKGTTNPGPYQKMFIDTEDVGTGGPTSEVIFKLERTITGQNGNWYQFWASLNSTVNGSPFFEVNRALFNLVNNDMDVRKFVIVDPTALILDDYQSVTDGYYKQNDVLPVGKYTITEGQQLLADVKVFRFSEMVLIRAEYYASIGDLSGVEAEVNAIRTARYGSTAGNISLAGGTVQDAWAAILTERRIELAFEGHRYIDLKRLGTLAGQGVDRDPRDCAFNGACTLSADDYRFTLPIPRSEQAGNPDIQQNPGYSN